LSIAVLPARLSVNAALAFAVFLYTFTTTPEIYTLSLHDALPISYSSATPTIKPSRQLQIATNAGRKTLRFIAFLFLSSSIGRCRSEEHTSELQSLRHLVCRLLLEKKKCKTNYRFHSQYRHIIFHE